MVSDEKKTIEMPRFAVSVWFGEWPTDGFMLKTAANAR